MPNQKIKPRFTINHSLSPKPIWINSSRIRLKFKGSCLKQENVIFTPNNVGNLFIVYKLDKWLQDLNTDFTVKDCLFGNVKITKNSNPDKYCYSGYEIEFDSCSLFSIPNFD